MSGPATSAKVTNTASLYKLWVPRFDAFNIWRRLSVLISEFPLHCDRWFCFMIPQNTLGFLLHWCHFDTSRLCNCTITINTLHKILETNLSSGKKYVCIARSFLVINVCNQGKTLCSPCVSRPLIFCTENWTGLYFLTVGQVDIQKKGSQIFLCLNDTIFLDYLIIADLYERSQTYLKSPVILRWGCNLIIGFTFVCVCTGASCHPRVCVIYRRTLP